MDISLRDLRRYAAKTQIEAARLAATTQSELSRLERRDDCLVSTLRRYLAGLGGSLELVVAFGSSSFRLVPDGPAAEPGPEDVGPALDALESLPSWLPPLVARRPAATLATRVAGCGTFSLAEHVWHLHDLELEGYGVRLRRLLAEDDPRLPDLDGDRLAAERRYNDRSIAPALRALVRARRRHVAQLRRLDAAALARAGELDGVGRVSLAALVLRWRSHDMGHRLEMERLAERLRAGG
jgi:hypothetical protein